ncbi:hypothetical protein V1281_003796 [Nitrobacteraceae bacterium AZCC 2161]
MPDSREATTLRAWLLSLLRFAVTLEASDRIMVLAAATELDRQSRDNARASAFRFFTRASLQLCDAITEPALPTSPAVIQAHLARIVDPRLQRAFAAALDTKLEKKKRASKCPAKTVDLWKGLGR